MVNIKSSSSFVQFLTNFLAGYSTIYKKFQAATYQQLNVWKNLTIFAIIGTLFGIYWYLKWEKVAMALLIIEIIAFVVIINVQNQKDPPKEDKSKSKTLSQFSDMSKGIDEALKDL